MRVTGQEIIAYRFGALEFKLRGLGVYFGGEKLNARVGALSLDEARAANREAWKLRRDAERRMDRYSNVTQHGCGPHDRATQEWMVAKAVCAATWKHMNGAAILNCGGVGRKLVPPAAASAEEARS